MSESYDGSADFPHWDESHATTLVSTDEVFVENDFQMTDDEQYLRLRRTVWRKARRQRDRHLLWIGTVALIPREQVPALARDLVSALI